MAASGIYQSIMRESVDLREDHSRPKNREDSWVSHASKLRVFFVLFHEAQSSNNFLRVLVHSGWL